MYINQKLTLVNLYGPNNDNPNFFQEISNCIDEIGNDEAIMCGDYNCVLNPELDFYNYKTINNTKACDKVLEIMNKKYLLDPFREKYPIQKKFTWKKRSPCKQARLDFFLISETLMQYVKNSMTDPSYRSDHAIVVLEQNLVMVNLTGNTITHFSQILII